MTEREMLATLCQFITTCQFVQGEMGSIKDMTMRYKSPPISLAYPIVMRLSVQRYNQLNKLLEEAHALLTATEPPSEQFPSDNLVNALQEDYDKNLKGQWDKLA